MKKLLKILSVFIVSFAFLINANAASSATISVTSSANQVIVGNKVTVYVKVSSSKAIGSWEYTLNYNSSLFKYVSSDVTLHYAGFASNANTKSVTYKYVFTALKSGSANFYVDSTGVIGFDDEKEMSVSNGSKKVNIITYEEYQASLSSNNNLKSLEVEGYKIEPEFNKDTLEYFVQVSENEEKVNIIAKAEDSKASINGAGSVEVTAGTNQFDILVIAENGAEKIYKLNVEVIDKNPINVEVDGKNYTVVKVAKNIEAPLSFIPTTVTIDEYEIPAFYSEILEYTLVGLKDEEGNIFLFIYNDGVYTKYTEMSYGNLTIYVQKMDEEKHGYNKEIINIGIHEIEVLRKDSLSRYVLIKGTNVENKETGLYILDTKDMTIQKYDDALMLEIENKMTVLFILCISFASIALVSIILLLLSKRKKKPVKINNKKEIREEKEIKKEQKQDKNDIKEIDIDFKDV